MQYVPRFFSTSYIEINELTQIFAERRKIYSIKPSLEKDYYKRKQFRILDQTLL